MGEEGWRGSCITFNIEPWWSSEIIIPLIIGVGFDGIDIFTLA